jgi:hypothetical protein
MLPAFLKSLTLFFVTFGSHFLAPWRAKCSLIRSEMGAKVALSVAEVRMLNYLFILLMQIPSIITTANAADVCSDAQKGLSTPQTRQELLVDTKKFLVGKANDSIISLTNAKNYLATCNESVCEEITKHLMSTLAEQVRISKILSVLSKSDVLYYEPLIKFDLMMQRNEIQPDDITQFKLSGFSFSDEEKHIAFELWKQSYKAFAPQYMATENITQPSGALQSKINSFFSLAEVQLVSSNPLLPFMTEAALTDKKELFIAFDKLIEFNKQFLSNIQGYKTAHKTGVWSYVNLAVADHEMGLVNFQSNIGELISNTQGAKRTNFCNAWNDLKIQQARRVRTSIGVGFTTAVICGVGIWSGVGSLPAAALCSFATADGLWGAYVGRQKSNLGYYSLYAGKVLNLENAKFSSGVMTYINAEYIRGSGNAVFLINLVGLLPIAKSVITASKGVRGSITSLLKIPSADVASSTSESASSQLVYVLLAMRGLELGTDRLTEIMADLR